jgi:SAM-dependent methyltransferase
VSGKAHSEEYIGEERLLWWRPAHLSNVLSSLACDGIRDALDVGVGQGHWTALLFGCLPPGINITGIDFEEHWVKSSEAYLGQKLPQHRYRAVQGFANELPLLANSFDLVTCQTVLMHLADAQGAIGEMVRVLRPGGFLLVAEPINQLNRAAVSHSLASKLAGVSDVLWRIWRGFHERRRQVHMGDHNIAVSLPGLIGRFPELHGLKAYHSDVVQLDGPGHDDLSVLIDELRKPENRKLMLESGCTEADIQQGADGIQSIIEEMNDSGAIIASPTPNILFCARKKAGSNTDTSEQAN